MVDTRVKWQPLVSIIIPVYNGANYLSESIDSALAQTYPKCEVVVINDGSTDNGATRDTALSYGDRVRYYEKENGGVSTALNMGIQYAKGEYISWLSHDDLYLPIKIERQISYLRTFNSNYVIPYSDFEIFDVGENKTYSHHVYHLTPYNYLQDMILLLFKSALHGCTFLLPIKCFSEVGYFDIKLITTQDYDLWFKLLKSEYQFKHIPEVLVRGRRHKDQVSNLSRSILMQETDKIHFRAVDNLFDEISTFPARIIFDIINNEQLLQNKCADYIVNKIRKEKPLLHLKLLIYKKLVHAKIMMDSYWKPVCTIPSS